VIILHVLEPFASGVTSAVSSIAGELKDFSHIVIHGSRNWTESTEKVKKRFPSEVKFIEWKNAVREISISKDLKALNELIKILKPYKKQKDNIVVHLHSSKAGFLGRIACRMLKIKNVIYTPHCGAFLRTDISVFKRNMYKFFEKIGSCFGGRVVGCGKSEGEIYIKLGKNTTYVSNGVKIDELQENSGQFNVSRTLIAFSGIASFQKDPVLWNEIAVTCTQTEFGEVAKKDAYSFCWIGDGPLSNVFNREIVDMTGWKTSEEVEELLKKTAVFFSASAWEGLPYGVLEAMNCGCALLLRNVPGNSELVLPNENGYLFNTKEEAVNSLVLMIKNKDALEAMGKKSREIAENLYSLKQMGDGYRKIYLEMLENNKEKII